MIYRPIRPLFVLLCAAALLLSGLRAYADDPLAEVILKSDAVIFQPRVEAESFTLTVTSPCGIIITRQFDGGDTPAFTLGDLQVENVDGNYSYNLRMRPILSGAEKELLADLRKNGDENDVARLRTDGQLFKQVPSQGGDFVVFKGAIVTNLGLQETQKRAATDEVSNTSGGLTFNNGGADLAGSGGLQNLPAADFVILDDLIVDGSACIGFDCVNGEVFSFDTIRLKENNLRIKFDDTSVAASFPRNDWQLTANDSANGGASKFSIDDISGGRTPFTVEANAPSHSLYVDDGGRIGNGTSTPSTEIHTVDGDTPTLRLQQDGSSGFEPQTWDVAGNETNFFIRDVTNGSALPFRIRPGAPTSSIFIDPDGDVGLGTSSPAATGLHVNRSTGGAGELLRLTNNGGMFITFENTSSNDDWFFTSQNANEGSFIIDSTVEGALDGAEFTLTTDGDLTLAGTLTIVGGCTGCDAVFQPGFEIESIEEHASSMWENSFLPGVGATPEGKTAINVFEKTTGILQELEKAHIYIEQLHKGLKAKDAELSDVRGQLSGLQERLGRLEKALASPALN